MTAPSKHPLYRKLYQAERHLREACEVAQDVILPAGKDGETVRNMLRERLALIRSLYAEVEAEIRR